MTKEIPLQSSESSPQETPLVSAIVSTYKSERFMRGLLDDLEAQTISDKLEIIIVDSNSPENERTIVEEFQQRYDNIVYMRTEKRESSHATWNRCIKLARGKYITLACTDDRRKPDALERMVAVLEARPDVALVYANVWITQTENETYEKHTRVGAYRWMDFDPLKLLVCCFMGPQPMWRRNLHEKYGYFDGDLESAGDWEFWLRMAEGETFLHIDEFLGLYLYSPTSSEHRDPDLSQREQELVNKRYAHRAPELWRRQRRAQLNLPATSGVLALVVRNIERNELVARCVEQLRRCPPNSEELSVKVVRNHSGIPENNLNVKISPPTPTLLEALRQAPHEARYVLLLSPDVLITQSCLDKLIAVADIGPSIAAVGPNVGSVSRRFEPNCYDIPPRFPNRLTMEDEYEEVPYLGGFCLLLKSDALCKVGGIQERVSLPLSLLDLYARFQAAGFKRVQVQNDYVHREEITGGYNKPTAIEHRAHTQFGALSAAHSALEDADFETAVIEFDRLTHDMPNLAEGHIALGLALMCIGRIEHAVTTFRRAIELAPHDYTLYNQLGVALYHLGDLSAAEASFHAALRVGPSNIYALLRLVEIYREQHRYVEATDCLKQAVRLAPNDAEVLVTLGVLGLDLGNPKPALVALKHIQTIEPEHPILTPLLESICLAKAK